MSSRWSMWSIYYTIYGWLTGRQLEGHGEAVMGAWSLGPLQLGVQRVQHVELHGLEEAVALVLEDDRHHHLTAVLQVSLDVAHLSKGQAENIADIDGYRKGNAEIIDTLAEASKRMRAKNHNHKNHTPKAFPSCCIFVKPVFGISCTTLGNGRKLLSYTIENEEGKDERVVRFWGCRQRGGEGRKVHSKTTENWPFFTSWTKTTTSTVSASSIIFEERKKEEYTEKPTYSSTHLPTTLCLHKPYQLLEQVKPVAYFPTRCVVSHINPLHPHQPKLTILM